MLIRDWNNYGKQLLVFVLAITELIFCMLNDNGQAS